MRLLLLIIVLLLTAQVCIQFFYPAGRYVQMSYPQGTRGLRFLVRVASARCAEGSNFRGLLF